MDTREIRDKVIQCILYVTVLVCSLFALLRYITSTNMKELVNSGEFWFTALVIVGVSIFCAICLIKTVCSTDCTEVYNEEDFDIF